MLAMYTFSVSGLNYLAHLLLITLCQQYFSPSGTKIGQLHVCLVPQLSAYHCLPLGCSAFVHIWRIGKERLEHARMDDPRILGIQNRSLLSEGLDPVSQRLFSQPQGVGCDHE